MADDGVGDAQVLELVSGHLAGIRSSIFPKQILGSQARDSYRASDRRKKRKGRSYDYFNFFLMRPRRALNLCRERRCAPGRVGIHFPVGDDKRLHTRRKLSLVQCRKLSTYLLL